MHAVAFGNIKLPLLGPTGTLYAIVCHYRGNFKNLHPAQRLSVTTADADTAADATKHVAPTHPRPLDVLTPFLFRFFVVVETTLVEEDEALLGATPSCPNVPLR